MKREKKGDVVPSSLLRDCEAFPDEPVLWDDMMPRRMDTPMFPGTLSIYQNDPQLSEAKRKLRILPQPRIVMVRRDVPLVANIMAETRDLLLDEL